MYHLCVHVNHQQSDQLLVPHAPVLVPPAAPLLVPVQPCFFHRVLYQSFPCNTVQLGECG